MTTASNVALMTGRAAHAYATLLRWRVFPCHTVRFGPDGRAVGCSCGSDDPTHRGGKHPRTAHGVLDATADTTQIAKWWADWPDANIGVACGSGSGFFAIDIDPRNLGDEELEALEDRHGKLPHTVTAHTGGGGRHYLFRWDERLNGIKWHPLAKGVDVKGSGGYIVVAPSNHVDGRQYGWEVSSRPGEIDLAPAPEWVIERLIATGSRTAVAYEGARDVDAASFYLGRAAAEAGWLGARQRPGVWRVRCPRESMHTCGERFDSSTILFAPELGRQGPGFFHCSHSHCSGITFREFTQSIPVAARRAADAAFPRGGRAAATVADADGVIVEAGELGQGQGQGQGQGVGVGVGDDAGDQSGPEAPAEPDGQVANADASSWQDRLLWDPAPKGGRKLAKNLANAITILRNDDPWRGVLAYDEFSLGPTKLRRAPWYDDDRPSHGDGLGAWTDEDTSRTAAWLLRAWGIRIGSDTAHEAVRVVAHAQSCHPVREYLDSLKWDGVLRIHEWLSRYLGAGVSEYLSRVGRWWLISAVARIYRPGCKVDHALILEGPQGAGKSSALRTLGGAWFSDTGIDLDSKDAYTSLRGKWILELSELASLNRSETGRIKAYFTSQIDNYRPPYGRETVSAPRQCVFAGTVNPAGGYLRDESGGRRFWPVAVGEIDLPALERDRDQLWAEARDAYRAGEPWWPSDRAQAELCGAEQAERLETDEWLAPVAAWLEGRAPGQGVTIGEVLGGALDVPRERWSRSVEIRVGGILRRLGWERRRAMVAGERGYMYVKR